MLRIYRNVRGLRDFLHIYYNGDFPRHARSRAL